MILTDAYVDRCMAHHKDGPVDGCLNCEIRATRVTCEACGGSWDGGEGLNDPGYCLHSADWRHVLFTDYGSELLCQVRTPISVGSALHTACGDSITTPGSTSCDFHQRLAHEAQGRLVLSRSITKAAH